jgi:hypothetical protein
MSVVLQKGENEGGKHNEFTVAFKIQSYHGVYNAEPREEATFVSDGLYRRILSYDCCAKKLLST